MLTLFCTFAIIEGVFLLKRSSGYTLFWVVNGVLTASFRTDNTEQVWKAMSIKFASGSYDQKFRETCNIEAFTPSPKMSRNVPSSCTALALQDNNVDRRYIAEASCSVVVCSEETPHWILRMAWSIEMFLKIELISSEDGGRLIYFLTSPMKTEATRGWICLQRTCGCWARWVPFEWLFQKFRLIGATICGMHSTVRQKTSQRPRNECNSALFFVAFKFLITSVIWKAILNSFPVPFDQRRQ